MAIAPATAAALARAFHDDPMFTYVEPDPQRRRRVLPWFFGAVARLGRQRGRVEEEPGRGCAIWLRPGRTRIGPAALVASGLVVAPLRFGRAAFGRFAAITDAFERAGAPVHGDSGFWHLFILGVDPSVQGRGLGARLIAPVLARADAAGQPCYLETVKESNLAFYQRHGFVVTDRHDQRGLPPFWTMSRQAQARPERADQ